MPAAGTAALRKAGPASSVAAVVACATFEAGLCPLVVDGEDPVVAGRADGEAGVAVGGAVMARGKLGPGRAAGRPTTRPCNP